MTANDMAHKASAINQEIIITHGLSDSGVGFVWRDTFIHNPFVDPQYGYYAVDPVDQYGDAYMESIFYTDPATALQMAHQQMRERTCDDLSRYCIEHDLDAAAVISAVCGVGVAESGNLLATLTDEQVVMVWSHVDGSDSGRGKIDHSVEQRSTNPDLPTGGAVQNR